ncbi:hypothetical protein ACQ4LE_000541 [Meloidogyne hapla]
MNQTYTLPPIYLAFSNPGFHIELFLPSLVMFPSIFGLFLNASVCYITWKYWGKYTALNSKTSVLIAINSFLEVLHQSGQFVFLYITATGINFIPALLAFEIEGYYVISTYVVTFMFLTMSIDKVIAIAFPLFYIKVKFRLYIYAHILALIIFAVFMFCLLISAIAARPDYPVTGNLSDFNGLPMPFDTRNMFIGFLILSILAHLIVGLLAKYKGDLPDEKIRRLFRSLSLIILLNIGGYFLYLASILASIAFITKNTVMIWYLGCYNALILNISAALNAPILYMNSSDYNEAYNKEFGLIKKLYGKCKSKFFNSMSSSSVTVL